MKSFFPRWSWRAGYFKRNVRLSWAWTTDDAQDANLGDALSAVLVTTISGHAVSRARFRSSWERLVAVGTIGHAQRNATVHLWGTGFDASQDAFGRATDYQVPRRTRLVVHALRGPRSAELLRARGVTAPDVFGDPVALLPKLIPDSGVRKTQELGVIVHITELETQNAAASIKANYKRYAIPETMRRQIRIINTYCAPDPLSLKAKVEEILSCKRIISTSLHGLVIPEAYGIPCGWFGLGSGGAARIPLSAGPDRLDHRMADYYAGAGASSVLAYLQERHEETDWDAVIRALDTHWSPLGYDPRALFEAFPLPKVVRFDDAAWPYDLKRLGLIRF